MPDRLFSTPCHLHITPLHLTYTLDMAIGQYACLSPPVPHKHPTPDSSAFTQNSKMTEIFLILLELVQFSGKPRRVCSAQLCFCHNTKPNFFLFLCHDCNANGSSCEKAQKHH